jgi:Family of unknown function (DUF6263)
MRNGRIKCGVLLVALLGTFVATSVRADDPLRWKFNVGEKLDYKMVQDMAMSASGPQIPEMKTTMRQEMNMTWDVVGVDEKSGEAVIRQKFDQIKMKMNTPVGGFEYDSKSEEAPSGLGAMIAPMYKAMTEGEFEITMTARGEVKDVKIPEQVLTALKNSPGAAAMGDIASADGFKKMISQGALVLPKDAPKKGESWTTKVEMKNPAVGKQTVETTYTYDGTKDVKGTTFAVIRPQLKMDFESKPADAQASQPDQPQQPAQQAQLQMKIKDQTSDGEVLFNIKAGRLHSTSLKQNVTIDASVQGKPIQQKIDQKIDVTVSPSGAKESSEPKKAESGEKAEKAEKAK